MSCGYACINCGKCKGEFKPLMAVGHCPACGADNPADALDCATCGRPLPQLPGKRATMNTD